MEGAGKGQPDDAQWDIVLAGRDLPERFGLRGKYVIAGRGYDSGRFVHWLEECGAFVVIPSHKIAKHPRNIDWHIYKERHLVENLFLKFKAHRRFSTRCEKRACLFLAVALLVSILLWIACVLKTRSSVAKRCEPSRGAP